MPTYVGIIYKDPGSPLNNHDSMESKADFFFVAQLASGHSRGEAPSQFNSCQ